MVKNYPTKTKTSAGFTSIWRGRECQKFGVQCIQISKINGLVKIPWEFSPKCAILPKNPLKPVFIDAYLFGEGKRETEKQREKHPKNAENFADEREEGKREMEI